MMQMCTDFVEIAPYFNEDVAGYDLSPLSCCGDQ